MVKMPMFTKAVERSSTKLVNFFDFDFLVTLKMIPVCNLQSTILNSSVSLSSQVAHRTATADGSMNRSSQQI